MALKQLMLGKKIEQRKSVLTELLTQGEALKKRGADLEASIEEAKTDEEIKLVEEETEKLEGEQKEFDDKKGQLEKEIADLEGELEELNQKAPKANEQQPEQTEARNKSNKEGETRMGVKKLN